jgi:beta-glucosidase
VDLSPTPFGGRNSEYFGEDPFLSASIVPQAINAIQAQGRWSMSKHYVANDQDTHRLYTTGDPSINEIMGERTLREIYLVPFESAAKNGHSASIMCAFPQANGTFASPYLAKMLRGASDQLRKFLHPGQLDQRNRWDQKPCGPERDSRLYQCVNAGSEHCGVAS